MQSNTPLFMSGNLIIYSDRIEFSSPGPTDEMLKVSVDHPRVKIPKLNEKDHGVYYEPLSDCVCDILYAAKHGLNYMNALYQLAEIVQYFQKNGIEHDFDLDNILINQSGEIYIYGVGHRINTEGTMVPSVVLYRDTDILNGESEGLFAHNHVFRIGALGLTFLTKGDISELVKRRPINGFAFDTSKLTPKEGTDTQVWEMLLSCVGEVKHRPSVEEILTKLEAYK